jgi:hypothetical protein|nr:hypothetical protein [Kofleriaceae bacterium]
MRATWWAVLAVAAACGNDTAPLAGDAAAHHDAAPDSSDGGSDDVALTVTVRGAPAGGLAVYFVDAGDAVVATATTDATGTARAPLAAGGSVTAVVPDAGSDGSTELDTIAGVAPGDRLHVAVGSAAPAPLELTIVVPADTGTSANDYHLFTPCGDRDITPGGPPIGDHARPRADNAPVTVTLDDCAGSAIDMVVETSDFIEDFDGTFYAPGVAIAPGATVTLPGPYGSAAHVAVTVAGVPSGELADSLAFVATPSGQVFDALVAVGSSSDAELPPVPDATAAFITQITPPGTGGVEQDIIDWGALGSAYAVDAGSALLAPITRGPTVDAPGRAVAWSQGSGAPAEFAVVAITTPAARWRLAAPAAPAAPAARFPTIPGVSLETAVVAELHLVHTAAGYDAAARAGALDFDFGFAAVPFAGYGTSGRIVIEQLR